MVVGIFFSFLQQMCVFIYFLVSGLKEPNPAELWTCLHAVISASSQSSFHSSSGFGSFLCVMLSVYLNWYWWMGCCCCPNVSLSPKPKLFFCKFLYHSLPNKYSAFLLMIIKLHLVSPVSGCQLQDVTSLHCCLHLLSKKKPPHVAHWGMEKGSWESFPPEFDLVEMLQTAEVLASLSWRPSYDLFWPLTWAEPMQLLLCKQSKRSGIELLTCKMHCLHYSFFFL